MEPMGIYDAALFVVVVAGYFAVSITVLYGLYHFFMYMAIRAENRKHGIK
jgi:hypothetical protein